MILFILKKFQNSTNLFYFELNYFLFILISFYLLACTQQKKETEEKKHLKTNLRYTEIMTIPSEVWENKTTLKELMLGGDSLFLELPDKIRELKQLEYLYISGKKLKKISKEIVHLDKLNHLAVTIDSLGILPKEIENMKSLWFLQLTVNHCDKLNFDISKIKNLSGVFLEMRTEEACEEVFKAISKINLPSLILFLPPNTKIDMFEIAHYLKNCKDLELHQTHFFYDLKKQKRLKQLLPFTKIIVPN